MTGWLPDLLAVAEDDRTALAWSVTACPYGFGEWLIATTQDATFALAAPSVPAARSESPQDRLAWRVATWQVPWETNGPGSAGEPDIRTEVVGVDEVLVLVGPHHAARVRRTCA